MLDKRIRGLVLAFLALIFVPVAEPSEETREQRCKDHVEIIEAVMDRRLDGWPAHEVKSSLPEVNPASDYVSNLVEKVYELPRNLLQGSKRADTLTLVYRDCLMDQ